jgi:hypothetical protein
LVPIMPNSDAVQAHVSYASGANHNSSCTTLIALPDPLPNATITTSFALAPPSDHLPLGVPRTHLQAGIHKPKIYTNDTVRYGLLAASAEPTDPSSTLSDPSWKQAMDSEYSALMHNQTCHLVPPASCHNLIDLKWVFKIKRKADGSIDRYKARLVAKGFRQ